MKTREARRVAKSLAAGNLKPLHVIRAASLQLKRPLIVRQSDFDLVYHPKELTGKFFRFYERDYRQTHLVPASQYAEYERLTGRAGYEYDSTPDTIQVNPHAGSSIQWISPSAAKVAYQLRAYVDLNFNDISLKVGPFATPGYAYAEWQRISDVNYQAYLNSDEYKQRQQEEAAERAKRQEKVDGLLAALPLIGPDTDLVVRFCRDYIENTDYNGVRGNTELVLQTLGAAGWVDGAHVHDPLVKTDKEIFAKWLVGQVMNCLATMGMAPPNVVHKFAEDYENWGENPPPNAGVKLEDVEFDDDEFDDENDDEFGDEDGELREAA